MLSLLKFSILAFISLILPCKSFQGRNVIRSNIALSKAVAVQPFFVKSKALFSKSSTNDEKINTKTIIIGAGVSGLACARALSSSSTSSSTFLIIDKNDKVGGRIQTEEYKGFLLDKGFQIFIDSYPQIVENKYNLFDSNKLKLSRFNPGATIRANNQFYKVADPLRQPDQIPDILFTPIGSFIDKIIVGIYSILIKFQNYDGIMARVVENKDKSTSAYLKDDLKLSDSMINFFFKPFYQGIFLAPLELQSSAMFQFVFKVLSQGYGCLPAKGMQQIPNQMLDAIVSTVQSKTDNKGVNINTADILLLNTSVTKIEINMNTNDPLVSSSPPTSSSTPNLINKDNNNKKRTYIVHATQKTYDVKQNKIIVIYKRFEAENVVLATDLPSARSIM